MGLLTHHFGVKMSDVGLPSGAGEMLPHEIHELTVETTEVRVFCRSTFLGLLPHVKRTPKQQNSQSPLLNANFPSRLRPDW